MENTLPNDLINTIINISYTPPNYRLRLEFIRHPFMLKRVGHLDLEVYSPILEMVFLYSSELHKQLSLIDFTNIKSININEENHCK
jgi:hypothetical protein